MMPYERFEAWKLCDELAVQVYDVTRSFPKYKLYGLTSQARRAAFSAPVNIAEGSAVELLDDEQFKRLDELRRRAGFLTWKLYEAVRKRKREGVVVYRPLPPPTASYRLLPPLILRRQALVALQQLRLPAPQRNLAASDVDVLHAS